MPYIAKAMREVITPPLYKFFDSVELYKDDIGNLNYIITRICLWWINIAPNYERYNEVIGALECAKLELYRRQVAPYEDRSIEANGDVK